MIIEGQDKHGSEGLGRWYLRCVVTALVGGVLGLWHAGLVGVVVGAPVGFVIALISLCFLPPDVDAKLQLQKTSTPRTRTTRARDRHIARTS